MSAKRISPYVRLQDTLRKWAFDVINPHRRSMWLYPKADLNRQGGWRLGDLYERVAAAKQLGYEVVLSADDDGLTARYVKSRPDSLPWELRG